MQFFSLKTPRDMLDKARREHARLQASHDIDNVFNFFVTAHHIRDYVLKTQAVAQVVLEEFLKSEAQQDCRNLCNKGKHLTLTQVPVDPSTITISFGGSLGLSPLGLSPLGLGPTDVWMLSDGTRSVYVRHLADTVMAEWEQFFLEHGL
ncbi:hypothetical protein ACFJGW_00765 [Burkholderiaceae bacterium UC74_6]